MAETLKKVENFTDKEKLFISNYLVHFNASRSAREAGYSEETAYSIGHAVLHKPHIRAEIDKRIEKESVTSGRIIASLAKIGFDGDDGEPDDNVATSDKLSALDKLAKVKGLYTENINHSGTLTIDQLINSFDDDSDENSE